MRYPCCIVISWNALIAHCATYWELKMTLEESLCSLVETSDRLYQWCLMDPGSRLWGLHFADQGFGNTSMSSISGQICVLAKILLLMILHSGYFKLELVEIQVQMA